MSGANTDPLFSSAETSSGRGNSRKRRAVQMDPEDELMEEHEPEKGDSNAEGDILQASTKYTNGTFVFTHHRILTTLGYNYKILKESAGYDCPNTTLFRYVTPYARVPCHGLPFYMTKAEYGILPVNTSIKKCNVQIKCLGYRLPFQTNSSMATTANSASLVLGVYGLGLQNKYGGQSLEITSTSAKPMIPNTVQWNTEEGIDTAKMWGKQFIVTDTPTFEDVPSVFGAEYPLQEYYVQEYENFDNCLETWPPIIEDLNIFKMTPYNTDSPVINWEYRPQIAVIKPSKTPQCKYVTGEINKNKYRTYFRYGYKSRAPISMRYHSNAAQNFTQLVTSDITEEYRGETDTSLYKCYIEHAGSASHGYQEYAGGFMPPSLHIGTLPTYTSTTSPKEDDVAAVTTLWSCRSTIELTYSIQNIDTINTLQPFGSAYLVDIDNILLGSNLMNVRGYKGNIYKEATGSEQPVKMANHRP